MQVHGGDALVRHWVSTPRTARAAQLLKRRDALEELVGEHTHRPQIHCAAVRLALDHLGREVVQRATQRRAPVAGRVHTPAKVGNLHLAADADQQVLGLDVTVDDVLRVQVLQRVGNLRNVPRGRRLVKAPVRHLGQDLEQLAAPGKLEHHENAPLVVEVAKHAQHVGVPQVHLDLDLAPQLQVHLVLHELLFVHTLERHDIALVLQLRRGHRLRPREVHAPKLALAERPPNLELRQTPLPRGLVMQAASVVWTYPSMDESIASVS